MEFSQCRIDNKTFFVLELDAHESRREQVLLARITVEYRREIAADFRLEAADTQEHLTLNDMPEKVDRLIFQPLFLTGAQVEVPVRFSLARPPDADVTCIAFRVADSVFSFPVESMGQESEIFKILCDRDGEEEFATQRPVLWLDDNQYRQRERAQIIDAIKKRAEKAGRHWRKWGDTTLARTAKTRDLKIEDFMTELKQPRNALTEKANKFLGRDRPAWERTFNEQQAETFYNHLTTIRPRGRPKKN